MSLVCFCILWLCLIGSKYMKNLREMPYHKFSIPMYHLVKIGALLLLFCLIALIDFWPTETYHAQEVVLYPYEEVSQFDDKCNYQMNVSKTDIALYELFEVDFESNRDCLASRQPFNQLKANWIGLYT